MSTIDLEPDFRPRKQKLYQKPWFPLAAAAVAGLIVGALFGAGGQKTERVEVPGPERVVTKTVEKEVTPEACLTALDLSEEGFSYSAEAMGYMSDALTAAGNIDAVALQEANDDLVKVSPKMHDLTAPMKAAVAKCRAAAK